MTDDRNDLDIISAALHGDKKNVLRAEIILVRNDLAHRLRINTAQTQALRAELDTVRHRILNIAPPDGTPTRDVLAQEKEAAALTRELREEEKDCWNDTLHLREVERQLLVQLAFLDQRDRRLREFFQ